MSKGSKANHSSVLLQARIKPEDLELICARAKAAGATMSAFVRAQCLSEPVRVSAVDSDLALAFERHARLHGQIGLLPLANELLALLKDRVVVLRDSPAGGNAIAPAHPTQVDNVCDVTADKTEQETLFRDNGVRIDVRKHDPVAIEAALMASEQKFDVSKGLVLTGDAKFKVMASEIAGRLGYPIQNKEQDVVDAWELGRSARNRLAEGSASEAMEWQNEAGC